MKVNITQPGTYTTIQDMGRYGLAHLGIPVSGCMDRNAAQLANWMVGNDFNEGVLEVTWSGLGLTIDTECSIAIAGALFRCEVNGQTVDCNQVIHLQAGDQFRMTQLLVGVRAYLAVAGGFDLDKFGGSVSTLTVAKLGGYSGRVLRQGDELALVNPRRSADRKIPSWKRIKPMSMHVIRAMPGPEINVFNSQTVQQAFGQAFQLSKDCSRQGFRLQSAAIRYPESFHMASSGLVAGSLQVTPNGQTIMAMQDAQTTGGYPRILVVNQDELHKLAQIRPGEDIYFFVART